MFLHRQLMLSKVSAMSSSSLNPKVSGEYLEGLQLSMMIKKTVSNATSTWVCILALLLASCVTLVGFLNGSVPHSPLHKWGIKYGISLIECWHDSMSLYR